MRAISLLFVAAACATSAPALSNVEKPAPAHPTAAWSWTWRAQAVREDARLAAYHEACGGQPARHAAVSPLLRFRTGGWSTPSGVVVTLSPLAGGRDELLAAVRCHAAYLAVVPAAADGPLALPGLVVSARGDDREIVVVVTAPDRAELQRRINQQVAAREQPIDDEDRSR